MLSQNSNSNYQSIPTTSSHHDGATIQQEGRQQGQRTWKFWLSCTASVVLVVMVLSPALPWLQFMMVTMGERFFHEQQAQRQDQSSIPMLQKSKTDMTKKNKDKLYKSYLKDKHLPMPAGVNLGSWLSLEDYFFAGQGSVEVATPFGSLQGACLPPLHLGPATGPRWGAESDLLWQLWKQPVSTSSSLSDQNPLAAALRVIHAHRVSFLDFETDLALLQELGITNVRVPLSWCWTDHEPLFDDDLSEDELIERFTCVDPFFGNLESNNNGNESAVEEGLVYWPAIPTSLLREFLRACTRHGIRAILDIHTYPGATSIGTFSGIWPKWPRFWQHDRPGSSEPDVGRATFAGIVAWVEALATSDPEAFAGIRALSPMNEPAHLTGLYDGPDPVIADNATTGQGPYVPELPPVMEEAYLAELNEFVATMDQDSTVAVFQQAVQEVMDESLSTHNPSVTEQIQQLPTVPMPAGAHLRVLMWLADATKTFGQSKLPQLGLQMHMNVIESIFAPALLSPFTTDPLTKSSSTVLDMVLRTQFIALWWNQTTTAEERSTWAVLDYHRYHAWDKECQGTVDGTFGNYTCGQLTGRSQTLTRCAQWAEMYRAVVDRVCGYDDLSSSKKKKKKKKGKPAQLASAEFSTATHHSVRHACQDVDTLVHSYLAQVEAGSSSNIELFYWSFQMPYGGNFRNAWSFKQFLYRAGILDRPDAPLWDCGEHVVSPTEPGDMSF